MTLQLSRTFFGTASLEREYQGFHVALRRGTVPPEAVPEHSHKTAHLILAIDDEYLSGAVGAKGWSGPSMLIYNPPGTLHRDRFATTGGRFLSIDFPQGFEPRGMLDPVIIRTGAARMRVAEVLTALLEDATVLEAEDHLLGLSAALAKDAEPTLSAPPWLAIAIESIADLANEAGLRVHDIAQIAGVHPVHLARVFARHLGCSPGHAIQRTRVERAAASLTKHGTLGDIAHKCGFADQAHMTRCFRSLYGTTPAGFRTAFD
jgi:AraC family transcriptional regulator